MGRRVDAESCGVVGAKVQYENRVLVGGLFRAVENSIDNAVGIEGPRIRL